MTTWVVLAAVAGIALGAVAALLIGRAYVGHRLAGAVEAAGLDTALLGTQARLALVDQLASTTRAVRLEAEQSRARLVAALQAFPQAVLLYDDKGAVTFANRAGTRFATPRHADALVEAAVRELVSGVRNGASGGARRVELVGPPHQCFDVAVHPLASAGGGAVAVVEDTTERRRLEEVRRDFVANISHELKTPIGAISLLTETMTEEPDPELVTRLASRLHDESMRVGRTIDDLLLLSHIEGDETPLHEPVRVGPAIAEAVGRVAKAAEDRSIDVKVEEPAPDLSIVGDGRQLVSALYNLLDNALKYSEPGSVVFVRATAAGDRVELAVEDHGIGIPARDLERVFERFYRVDKGRSRRTGGTGLGLAIVRHVVQNHGGEVTVRSREGEGSTFTLVLPRSGATTEA